MSANNISLDKAFKKLCGDPFATADQIQAWNKLDMGSSVNINTSFKVGLFYYDMTCVKEVCAKFDFTENEAGYCSAIPALGVDGLSFGIQSSVVIGSSIAENYCAGFRNDHAGGNIELVG